MAREDLSISFLSERSEQCKQTKVERPSGQLTTWLYVTRHALILLVAYHALSIHLLVGQLVPFWAAAPKGPMTYAFTQEKFLLLRPSTPFEAHILALRLKSQPRGPNSSLKAQILALRLKSQPQGSNPILKP